MNTYILQCELIADLCKMILDEKAYTYNVHRWRIMNETIGLCRH